MFFGFGKKHCIEITKVKNETGRYSMRHTTKFFVFGIFVHVKDFDTDSGDFLSAQNCLSDYLARTEVLRRLGFEIETTILPDEIKEKMVMGCIPLTR